MAEITEKAYESIRAHLVETITRVELQDESGEQILNRPIATDDRFTWIHPTKEVQTGWDDLGNQIYSTIPDTDTLQLEMVIKGSDSNLTLPVTFAQSVLSSDTEDFSVEAFEPFSMTQADDQITIVHSVEVPKVKV
ncbi:hypothetical protein [Oceanobacillus sp. CAU 1775]